MIPEMRNLVTFALFSKPSYKQRAMAGRRRNAVGEGGGERWEDWRSPPLWRSRSPRKLLKMDI